MLDIDGTLNVFAVYKKFDNELRIIDPDGEFECSKNEVTAKRLLIIILKQLNIKNSWKCSFNLYQPKEHVDNLSK